MSIHDLQTLPAKFENMADKENGFVLGFFEEFLEECMPSNSSYFVVSERHIGKDNHKGY